MSLYEVFKKFIDFFTNGATAPEIVQLFSLTLTFGFIWFFIFRPIIKLLK